jgi:hypothetical protein
MPCSSVSVRNEPRIVARNEASTIETGSSARHHDALALAARKLVREAAEDLLRLQTDRAQCLADPLPGLGTGGGQPEAAQRRREHVVDPVERVVDTVGILEHRLHVVAEGAPAVAVEPTQIGAAIADGTAGWLGQAEQQAGEGRLA